jgi:D-alanyl-D-alanine carboxypeptidase
MLAEQGKLSLDDPIIKYFDSDFLNNLFVFNNTDYSSEVTVKNLLSHTSGIADYFESSVNAGSKFVDVLLSQPDKLWNPQELLDFTRNNQKALSAPGEFHYSDTGYVLLGMLAEKVTSNGFADLLKTYIFDKCQMNDSYLMFYGQPNNQKQTITSVWFSGQDISQKNMLSCDWAGGGLITTLEDLSKFQNALWNNLLIGTDNLDEMQRFNNKFRSGMMYGMGMMQLQFSGFFFLLKGLMTPVGHSGILGTHLYYDEPTKTHIVMNFGSNKRMVDSVKALIFIAQNIKKIT